MRLFIVSAVALVLASASSAQSWGPVPLPPTPVTKDRLSTDAMDVLAAAPMTVLKTSGLAAAQKAFDQLLSKTRQEKGAGSIEEADLQTSFGVALYMRGLDEDAVDLKRASLPYLERAVASYRSAFGTRDPEVAVALNSYADAMLGIRDEALQPKAKAALEEAVAIRKERLGQDNPETKSATEDLARVGAPPDDADPALTDALKSFPPHSPAAGAAAAAATKFTDLTMDDLRGRGLWMPSSYADPIIDDFALDVRKIDHAPVSTRAEVAKKYGLLIQSLDEGLILLRDMDNHGYDMHRTAGLRARALGWLEHSGRAPVAVAYIAGILGQLSEGGCTIADLDALMHGSRDRDRDLWLVGTTCGSSQVLATALDRSISARSALFFWGQSWTNGDWPSQLAAFDYMLRPDYLSRVSSGQRSRVQSEIVSRKLTKLIDIGLLDEALNFAEGVDPAILRMALQPRSGKYAATIDGFALKSTTFPNAVAENYAAILALAGRSSEARATLDLIGPAEKRKQARACLDAAKPDCEVGSEGQVTIDALVVDQFLTDPRGDPYVLLEPSNRGFSSTEPPIAETLCRMLDRPSEQRDCADERSGAAAEPEALDAGDRKLWNSLDAAGGPSLAQAMRRYAALIPARTVANASAPVRRASIDPAPPPFSEKILTQAMIGKVRANPAPNAYAALPPGYSLVRFERSGSRAVAVSLSTRYDPNGEVSAGGYWVHLSNDGGKTWDQPLYTGLAEFFPYVVPATSRLPMIAGDNVHVEVREQLIDTASISYPPVRMHVRRKRSGIFLDIPLADLRADRNGDRLTDIAAHHLLLDEQGGSTPFVVGRDKNCSNASPETLARLEILKQLFEAEASALVETPDHKSLSATWQRIKPSGKPPIFLLGNPDDWRCVFVDRPMVVYGKDDRDRLRRFSPDFQLIELPSIRWNRTLTRGFVRWNMGWTGGAYRLTRDGGGWKLETISSWIS